MGRRRINFENYLAGFQAGTLARIDAVLREKEKHAEFIRAAVDRELRRREREQPKNEGEKA